MKKVGSIFRNYLDEEVALCRKLGSFPLSYSPTVEELKASRGFIQRAYRGIKRNKWDATIIDIIGIISIGSMLFSYHGEIKPGKKDIEELIESGIVDHLLTNAARLAMRNPKVIIDVMKDWIGMSQYLLDYDDVINIFKRLVYYGAEKIIEEAETSLGNNISELNSG